LLTLFVKFYPPLNTNAADPFDNYDEKFHKHF